MKNLHVIPTDKPSRLFKANQKLVFDNTNDPTKCISAQHIYITNDEQPKHNDYYTIDGKKIYYCNTLNPTRNNHYKKIILTTDQDLIKDGVQAIGDEYLEWYIWGINYYKIIIPKEESIHLLSCCKSLEECHCGKYSKQETLEEAAEINCESITHPYCDREKAMFIKGAKWQQERMYSEEEAGELVYNIIGEYGKNYGIMIDGAKLNELFEQFKKK
jgi:hypothetical protein